MTIDLAGHLAYVSILFGTILVARRSVWGWIGRAVGHLSWLGIGVALGLSSIYVWEAVFVMQDLWAFREWRKQA